MFNVPSVARNCSIVPQQDVFLPTFSISPRSHPRHIVGKSKTYRGKKTARKDTIKDITSDRQVTSIFTYRWPPASLTFNIYFHIFLYLNITRMTINKDTPHLKSPKNQNGRAALEQPAIKLGGGGGGGGGGASTSLRLTNLRPLFCLGFSDT